MSKEFLKIAKEIAKKAGNVLKEGWINAAKKNKILIEIGEIKTIPTFRFNYDRFNEKLYTIFTNLMLKEKYLATNSVYLSFNHNFNDIKKYLIACDKVFKKISNILKDKKKLNKIKPRKYNY